jgi:hypothetical protein
MRFPRIRQWTLLRKFTVLSLACFAVLGIALAQLLAHEIRQRALSNTVSSAELLSSTLASTEIKPADLVNGMDAAGSRALDTAVAQAQAQHRIARLKIWSKTGRIVYSDDHAAIGQRFKISDDLQDGLNGHTHSSVSTGQSAEQKGERHLGPLLEAYVPLRFTARGAPAGAFEIYVPYAPVAAASA